MSKIQSPQGFAPLSVNLSQPDSIYINLLM